MALLLANILLVPFVLITILTIGMVSLACTVAMAVGCIGPMLIVIFYHLLHFEFTMGKACITKSLTICFLRHRLMFLTVMVFAAAFVQLTYLL